MPIGIYRRTNEHIQKLKSNQIKKMADINSQRTPWNKGMIYPIEIKQKMSKSHLGKTLSEEHISKIKLGTKGRMFSEIHKKHLSENHKGNLGKKHSDKTKALMREKRLHIVFPKKDTYIERIFQNRLQELNIVFEKHKALKGQPDIFIEPNICIFLDGCYWHKCSICGFGNGREVDKKITETLEKQGYIVLRFWEHDIRNIVQLGRSELNRLQVNQPIVATEMLVTSPRSSEVGN